jgi:hypothetical protein
MSLSDYSVKRDMFDTYDKRFIGIDVDMSFPCCCCKYHLKKDTEHPCRVCDHNMNAVP